ncbi:MAG: hypothetical protein ABH864_02840 [archaeon]
MAVKARTETIEIATLDDSTIRYSAPFQPQGPTTWRKLHDADYGKNPLTGEPLRQQTFPEAVRMFNFAQAHKCNQTYVPIIQAVNTTILTGNSLLLWTPESLYGVDFPDEELVAQLGVDDQSTFSRIETKLQDRLSKRKRIGEHVRLSQDGFVRYTPSQNIIYNKQDSDILATNPATIVETGTLQNSHGAARSSKQYPNKPFLYGLQDVQGATVRVPGLFGDFGDRLNLGGRGVYDNRCSFGGTSAGEASARKK